MENKTIQTKSPTNFEEMYKQIVTQQLTTIEALYQMFEHKKSIKKIKLSLISLRNKNNQIETMLWKDKKYKKQFIKICNELRTYFMEENQKSMRSTQKNLSQMNQEITKMRKSLSEKGILLQFQNLQKQENNYPHPEIKNEQQKNESYNKNQKSTERNNNKQIKDEQDNYDQSIRNETINNEASPQNQNQNEQNKTERKEQSEKNQDYEQQYQEQLVQKKGQNLQQKPQQVKQKQRIYQIQQKNIQIKKQQHKKQINQTENKISLQSKHHYSQNKNQQITNKQQISTFNNMEKEINQQQKYSLQHNLEQHKKQKYANQTQWAQIPLPIQKLNKSRQKLRTLPEQIDNQFYEEDNNFHKQKVQTLSPRKVPKYNPHLQIMKKLNKNKKQQPQPQNQLQYNYYGYRSKLSKIFAHYVKQLKTENFTFDAYPNSLDLKTFSAYYKNFKLAQFLKIVDVPRYFKKYAINGAYLNQDGFILVHEKIVQLGDIVLEKINTFISDKIKYQSVFQQQIKKNTKSQLPEKQKKSKQIQMLKKKQQFYLKYNEFKQKLQKLNNILPEDQIKRLIRKVQKKPSTQNIKKLGNYDPEKLKKIVEAHSGIYKEDIIERLNQRKRQKEKRHEVQMHKILQKYKAQQPANSGSSFNKSNQSVPHLHKIQGYAKINKIKKYSDLNQNKIQQFVIQPNQKSRSKQQTKTQSKIKPYFISKQVIQQSNDSQKIQNILASQKKPQIFRELSLPKLPKRKMRQQSIYEALKLINTKNTDIQFIKSLIGSSNNSRQDEKILNEFYSKQKMLIEKQKSKKSTSLQNRMKFT